MLKKAEGLGPGRFMFLEKKMDQHDTCSLKEEETDEHLTNGKNSGGVSNQVIGPHRAHEADLKEEKTNDNSRQKPLKGPWLAQSGKGRAEGGNGGGGGNDEFPIVGGGLRPRSHGSCDDGAGHDASENTENQPCQGLELPCFLRHHRAKLLNGLV